MTLAYYQNQSKFADLLSEPFQQVVIRQWLGSINKNGKVLDFGSGAGLNLKTLDDLGFKKIFACDVSRLALSLVGQKHPKVKKVLLKNSFLPFADQSFSLILATEVLEHIPCFAKTLGELDRILKKEGCLLITTPNYLNMTGLIKVLKDSAKRGKDWNPWHSHKGGFEHFTTPFSFAKYLKNFKKIKSAGLDFYLAWFYLLPKRFSSLRKKLIYFPGNLPIFKYFCMHYYLLLKKN